MYKDHLVQAGLTPDEASIYETLAIKGPQAASKVSGLSGVPRTLAYKVLGDLEKKGLVVKKDPGKGVATFSATHPNNVLELALENARKAEQAKLSLNSILSALVSEYTKRSGEPGVRILPGIEGVRELYRDILNERKDIRLIRSPHDDSAPELATLIANQIDEQVAHRIKTRAITPMSAGTPSKITANDAERGVVRRMVDRDTFQTPAQILIYGNKVAVTSYEPVMTTIIENEAIRATLETMFEFIWSASEETDKRLREGMQA